MLTKKEIDPESGVETTGHEWDGIKELNNPAPRWWLWVFLITCIWSFCYWFFYPTWPTMSEKNIRGGTKGSLEWTQYKQLKQNQKAINSSRLKYLKDFNNSSIKEIMNDKSLFSFAVSGGNIAFKDNCSTCHGNDKAGANGFPNLNDDDWLWGGSTEEIYKTIKYGVRSSHELTHVSDMPSFKGIISKKDINKISNYILNMSNKKIVSENGKQIYMDNCASCHGINGQGEKDLGAPNLVDSLWLYGTGEKSDILSQIINPKHGVMPHWEGRLTELTIRQLTVYVHSLGGGE